MTESNFGQKLNNFLRENSSKIVPDFSIKMRDKLRNPIIYHYTNGSGLRGILENHCLWGTSLAYVNDARELKHGQEKCYDVITMLREKRNANSRYDELLRILLNEIENLKASQVYATCFSKNGDQLSQWRGYASNTTGYSIGFDAAELLRINVRERNVITEGTWTEVRQVNIIYDSVLQSEVLTKMIDTFASICAVHELFADSKAQTMIARWLMIHLEELIVGFKHHSFEEERESRIFVRSDNIDEVKLRERNGAFIPYIEFAYAKNSKLPIRKIIISPTEDYERKEASLQLLLQKTGYDDVEIKRSESPYRTV